VTLVSNTLQCIVRVAPVLVSVHVVAKLLVATLTPIVIVNMAMNKLLTPAVSCSQTLDDIYSNNTSQ